MSRPRFSLKSLEKRRSKLRTVILGYQNRGLQSDKAKLCSDLERLIFAHDVLDDVDEDMQSFSEDIHVDRQRAALRSCLDAFSEPTFTLPVCYDLCYLLAAWWDRIRAGIRYTRWTVHRPAWGLIRVADIRPVPRENRSFAVTFRCEAGPPVLSWWERVVSSSYLTHLGKMIGFPKFKTPFDAEDLMNTYFIAVVRSAENGTLDLSDVQIDSAQSTWNKKLLQARQGECIGPQNAADCGICRFGIDSCRIGRWSTTYSEQRECPNGHLGFYRPDVTETYCLSCLLSLRYKITPRRSK